MDLSLPIAMAGEKSHLQEPAAFEQVTVNLTEEILLDFDPYLFALSGSNLQQYCTLLSWLEMQKRNSEVFLETEEGVATPLSLVHIEENFNTSPSLYQGDEVAQIKDQENTSLVRLQYNFVREANLPTRSSNIFLASEKAGLFPELPKSHPYAKGLMKDFNTATAHQGNSLHVKTTYVSLKQHGGGLIPQGREHNNPPDAVVAGGSSQEEGQPNERSPPEKENHPGNNIGANDNQLPTSEVHEKTCHGEASSGGPNSSEKHLCPVTHQQVSHEGIPTFRCPRCSHSFDHSSASLEGQGAKAAVQSVKVTCSSKEKAGEVGEKPFHCPDCGKGFLHRSSIPRHQRLHRKEDSSPGSVKQRPSLGANYRTLLAVKSPVIKRQRLGGIEQPFRCPLCDKSYGQRSHLRRHQEKKHRMAQ